MKTPMQELFDELKKAEPTLMNLHSSDGRRFVEKYHDFLIKEEQEKIDFAVGFLHWVRENDYVYSGGAGWYKDEFDIVIVNAINYITTEQLIQLYLAHLNK